MLYATDRCNSKCKHCFIWDKHPKQHLTFDNIKDIVNSRAVTKDTVIGLEGGEFILHPEAEKILEYLSKNHPKFDILSNGVITDKLIEYVKKYKPIRLFMSLDGDKDTYIKMRGIDAYDNVIKIVEALHDVVPVSLMFTLTTFNNFDDLKHVASVCKKYSIDMRVGIYNTMEYFDTKDEGGGNSLDFSIEDIPTEVRDFEENYDFVALYTKYREGNLKLSCNSIKDSIVIYPNGDIPICQNKQMVLGNINKEPLYKIINKKSTRKLHKQNKNGCNGCWINFHRKYDVVLYRSVEPFLPNFLVKLIFGDYYWDKKSGAKYNEICK